MARSVVHISIAKINFMGKKRNKMKDKIIEILKSKAGSSMNMHAAFDNVDETQFDGIADEILKFATSKRISCTNYAKMKSVSRQTVYNWANSGKVQSEKIDGTLFIIEEKYMK